MTRWDAEKRQVAPPRKGQPKRGPKPPGRKAGKQRGAAAFQEAAAKVEDGVEAPLPAAAGC